jgi:rhodanese-related sulfurtransferase
MSSVILDNMIHSIGPEQAQELIAHGTFDVVDVREPGEWTTGHLPGARLVPLGRLRASPGDMLPRDGILFVCAAGIRSQTAAKLAEAEGRTNLYNLSGGTRGWASAGLPLVRD